MKQMKQYVLCIFVACFLPLCVAKAQEPKANSLEAMSVVQQGAVLSVKLTFKEPLLAIPSGFSVAQPARVALDFLNTTNGLGKSSQTYNEGDLRSTNVVQAEGRTRLVFNLKQAMTYEAKIDGSSLLLSFVQTGKADGSVGQPAVFAEASASKVSNSIRDVSFRRGKDGEARITVDLSDSNAGIDIRQQGPNLVVDFVKVNIPETLRKRLDVTDFATPVTSVNTVQQGANTRMTITPRGLWEHNAYQTDNQFVIEVKQVVENQNKLVQGSRGGYQGEKLSLNFQNVDVRRLLQVIGEFTGMNMVVSDSVQGAITLILKDVPWDQALDIIMQQKGLDMRKNGNVILIAPREEIATKEKLDFESKAQIGDLEPLRTESYQMNYIKGADVLKLLLDPKQTLLSKRGSALLDDRSNMMFIKDTSSRLDDVREMIAKVDIPTRQVLIEARIVEADDSFSKNLGVRFGYNESKVGHNISTGPHSPVGGNYTVGAGGLASSSVATSSTTIGDGYNVNLPATPKTGIPGALSFILFNQARTQFLNLEISALEADGRGKVISSPRVMTSNQVEALIEQGVEIPYQQATSSGATSISFRKANLSLKVKPQITPDGKIAMALDINKDTPSSTVSTNAGVAIDTKHVKTEVLVDNGGTVVIGGIYTQQTSENTSRIPFFGDLPYVGFLFKNNAKIDNKTELLVFITPKIVTDKLNIR
jgi:type IV pilus assembly protein PilQ